MISFSCAASLGKPKNIASHIKAIYLDCLVLDRNAFDLHVDAAAAPSAPRAARPPRPVSPHALRTSRAPRAPRASRQSTHFARLKKGRTYLEQIQWTGRRKEAGRGGTCSACAGDSRQLAESWRSKHGGTLVQTLASSRQQSRSTRCSNSPVDHIVYDVSHQTYPHKMLTGRKQAYMDPRSTTRCLLTSFTPRLARPLQD